MNGCSFISEFSMGQAAQILGIGRNTMMKRLRDVGVLDHRNIPKAIYNKGNLFIMAKKDIHTRRGNIYFKANATQITPKGLEFIERVINGDSPTDILKDYIQHTNEGNFPELNQFNTF